MERTTVLFYEDKTKDIVTILISQIQIPHTYVMDRPEQLAEAVGACGGLVYPNSAPKTVR